jgi:Acetoacetate decarboxylase (ADC)
MPGSGSGSPRKPATISPEVVPIPVEVDVHRLFVGEVLVEGALGDVRDTDNRFCVNSDTLVGTLDYGTLRVATATMGYKHFPLELDKARTEVTIPTFMLKVMRNYDGRPRICELVRTEITEVTVPRRLERTGPPATLRARARPDRRPPGARDKCGLSPRHRPLALAGRGDP